MRKIVFSPTALQQLDHWKQTNPKISNRIVILITAITESPFSGVGKPEPLKHSLHGKWSRRITQEHRLVYEVTDSEIRILSCRFHYD
ncbi:MAG TPA: Txe/YoeB family addiction module toxin [Cyclobacteriaceae bacterium]|jgi:toxin YoeB|nr:Txe/YoeB family addiction module toxin [Cytophagales bacterium]HMR58459.1 Txe/YoeB family addiction module toxin [Cyclobacteriaceae bacterium]HNT50194.1 Txe/YoeB family addiction module toxin [Cyclobacteriaceae bacterium]HRE66105.1 Txe/YoeB family addiction module toxin [Cyclobacteriaceae bacterium]HRF32204.1 Txe/YoeB family addiction module toxin [Cyclobacteriaceae bacterium]